MAEFTQKSRPIEAIKPVLESAAGLTNVENFARQCGLAESGPALELGKHVHAGKVHCHAFPVVPGMPRAEVCEEFLQVANAGVKPPRGGVATACSVAQSTLLTPRCGVGLNDLLGAKEAGEGKALADLPKDEAGKLGRAPANFQPDVTETTVSVTGN